MSSHEEKRLARVASNLASLHRVAELERALRERDIPVVRLKGSAYLGPLYPSLERWMADVDLLVRRSDRDGARRVLEHLGYGLLLPHRGWRHSWGEHCNWQFTAHDALPMVELHTALCTRGLFRVDTNRLFERRVQRSDGGNEMWTLSPEDALLHVAVHLVKDGYRHDQRLAEDSRRIVEVWSPDWGVVCTRARQWGVTAGLHYVLEAAQSAGAPVPPAVLDELAPATRAKIARAAFDRAAPVHARFPRVMKLAALGLEPDGANRVLGFMRHYLRRRAMDAVHALRSPTQDGDGVDVVGGEHSTHG